MTLLDLRTIILDETDNHDNPLYTTSEINRYINSSAGELHDLLVSKYSDNYFYKTFSFTLPDGSKEYNLPSDFGKMLGLDLVEGDYRTDIKRFDFRDRNRDLGGLKYRLMGKKLLFNNAKISGPKNFEIHYVPTYINLVADSDSLDSIVINGWEEYIIVDVAMKMIAKAEQDASPFINRKNSLLGRIDVASANRDAGEPSRVGIVRNRLTGRFFWDDTNDYKDE